MKARLLLAAMFVACLPGCSGDDTLYEASFTCGQLPADDEPLRKWFESQPGVREASVTRAGKNIRVRYTRSEPSWEFQFLVPPFQELGYGGVSGANWETSRPSQRALLARWLADAPLGFWLVIGGVLVLLGA